jgi:hypothetical protein
MNEKRQVTKDRLLSEERKRGTPLRIMKETRQLKDREKQKSRRERQTASRSILRSPGKGRS